jgi:hypothetical protein
MADKPKSTQEKITLRPTPVGRRVMQRLSIPHTDKSGELRRLIELGFAAELAGFILDGETLRFGGRVWDLRPDLELGTAASTTIISHTPSSTAAQFGESAPQPGPGIDAPADPQAVSRTPPGSITTVDPASAHESPLLANLRNLAGGS